MTQFKQLSTDFLTPLLESEVKLLTPSREERVVSKQTVFITILQKIESLVHSSFLSGSAISKLIKQDFSIPPNDLDWKLLVILPSDERYDRYLQIQTAIIDALSALISQNPAPSNLKQLGLTSKQFTAYSQNHSATTFTIPAPKGSLPLEISCHFLSKESDLTYLEHDLYIPLTVFNSRLGSNDADQFMISTHLPIEGTIDSFLSEIQENIISYDPPIGEPKDPAKWIRLMLDLSEKGLYAPSSQIGATWLTEASILNPTTLVSKLLRHAESRRSGIPDYQFFLLLNASMQTDTHVEIQQALLSQLLEASFSVQDLAIQKLFSSLASSLLKLSPSIQTHLLLTCCTLFYPLFATKKETRLHGNDPHLHLEKHQANSNQVFYTLIPLDHTSIVPEELLLTLKMFLEKGDLFHGTLCLLGSSLLREKERSHLELLFQVQNPPEVLDEEVLLNALIKIQGRELSLFFCKNCLRTSSSSTLINECLTSLNRESPSAIWELYKEVYKVKELARTIETNHLEGFLQTIPKNERTAFLPLFLHRIQETPFKKCFALSSFFMTLDPSPKEALTCFSTLLDKAQTPEEKESAIALCNLDCYIQENATPPTAHLPLFITYFISQHKNGLSFDALLCCLDWIALTPRDIFDEEAATWIRSLLHPFTHSLETIPSECWQKLHGLLHKASFQEPWKKVWCFLIFNLLRAESCKEFLRDLSTFTFSEELPQNLKRMPKKLSELYVKAARLLISINHPEAIYYVREALQNSADGFELDSTFQFLYNQKEYSTCLQLLIHEESFQTALSLLPYYKKIIKQVPKAETSYKRTIARLIQSESPETLWNLYLTEGDAADQLEEHVDFSSCAQISQPSQYKTYMKQRLTSTNYPYKLLNYLYDLKEPQASFLELVEKQIRSDNKITVEMIDLIFKTCIKELQPLSSKLPAHLRRELLKNCSVHASFSLEDHWDLFVSDLDSFSSESPLSLLKTVSAERHLELIHLLFHHNSGYTTQKTLSNILKEVSNSIYTLESESYLWTPSSLQRIWNCRPPQFSEELIFFILKKLPSFERSISLLKELIPYFDLRSKNLFKNKALQELLSHLNKKTQLIDLITQREFHHLILSDQNSYLAFLKICINNVDHLTSNHLTAITLPLSFEINHIALLKTMIVRLSVASMVQEKLKDSSVLPWFISQVVFLLKNHANLPEDVFKIYPSLLDFLHPHWNEICNSFTTFILLYQNMCNCSINTLERYAYLIAKTSHLETVGGAVTVSRHLFSKLLELKKPRAAMLLFEKICIKTHFSSIHQMHIFFEFFLEKQLPAEEIERLGQTEHFIHLVTLYLDSKQTQDQKALFLITDKILDLALISNLQASILNVLQNLLPKINPNSPIKIERLFKLQFHPFLCNEVLRISPDSSIDLLQAIYSYPDLMLDTLFKITMNILSRANLTPIEATINHEIIFLSEKLQAMECTLSQIILQNLIIASVIYKENALAVEIHTKLTNRIINIEEYIRFLKDPNICQALFTETLAIDCFLKVLKNCHSDEHRNNPAIFHGIRTVLSEIFCLMKRPFRSIEQVRDVTTFALFYAADTSINLMLNETLTTFQFQLSRSVLPENSRLFFEWLNNCLNDLDLASRYSSLVLFQTSITTLLHSKIDPLSEELLRSVLAASRFSFKIKAIKYLRQITHQHGVQPIEVLIHNRKFISHSQMQILSLYIKTFYDYSHFGYTINKHSIHRLPNHKDFDKIFNWNAFYQNPHEIDPSLQEFFSLITYLMLDENHSPYSYDLCTSVAVHLFKSSQDLPLFDEILSFAFKYDPIKCKAAFLPQLFNTDPRKWHHFIIRFEADKQISSQYKSAMLLENLKLLFTTKNTPLFSDKQKSLELAFDHLQNSVDCLDLARYFFTLKSQYPQAATNPQFIHTLIVKLSQAELFHLNLEQISTIWNLMVTTWKNFQYSIDNSTEEIFAKILHPIIQTDAWVVLSVLKESTVQETEVERFCEFTAIIYKILLNYRDSISSPKEGSSECYLINNISNVLIQISETWEISSLIENKLATTGISHDNI